MRSRRRPRTLQYGAGIPPPEAFDDPPTAGVREPRRPSPGPPAASEAIPEPDPPIVAGDQATAEP